jgi:hypothetical protein
MKMRRVMTLALVSALLLGVMAVPAGATPPERVTFNDDYSGLDPYASAECGFDVWLDRTAERRITTFFNRDGEPILDMGHDKSTNVFTRVGTDRSVTYKEAEPFKLHIENFLYTSYEFIGGVFVMTVPGEGIVLQDTGRVTGQLDFTRPIPFGTPEFLSGAFYHGRSHGVEFIWPELGIPGITVQQAVCEYLS